LSCVINVFGLVKGGWRVGEEEEAEVCMGARLQAMAGGNPKNDHTRISLFQHFFVWAR
jgi:hypothetical protein